MTLTTMGGIPFHVVEYTAAVPAVSHATPPQHAWALTTGSNLVVKPVAGRIGMVSSVGWWHCVAVAVCDCEVVEL